MRVWDNVLHTEVARLAHLAPVVAAAWMEDDAGIVSLTESGAINKWARTVSGLCMFLCGRGMLSGGRADSKRSVELVEDRGAERGRAHG